MKKIIRSITTLVLVISFLLVISGCALQDFDAKARNLIPDTPGTSPNYWCTWGAQNYMYGQGEAKLDPILLRVDHVHKYKSDSMTEENMFGPKGWATTFFPKVRQDLFFVLDDGWDIPVSNDYSYRNLGDLDPKKYPSFKGTIPEKWSQLNARTQALGWRGIGLWFRTVESAQDKERKEKIGNQQRYERLYWGERFKWSKDSGIGYWKMDVGGENEKIAMMMELKKKIFNDLVFETGLIPPGAPFNKIPEGMLYNQDFIENGRTRLTLTDAIRLYDISPQLGNATMLLRFATITEKLQHQSDADALLDVEEEVYLAAALGATMGIFRSPMIGLRPDPDPDIFLKGPRNLKKRLDEVVRAVRWQRIAPAFAANAVPVEVDTNYLIDTWKFKKGEFWYSKVEGKIVKESAPARVTRGLPLPRVSCKGEMPFILASRNPNGAISIASIGRVLHDKGYITPEADVTLEAGSIDAPVGIFGYFKNLTLEVDKPFGKVSIWAQDLAGDSAIEITDRVTISGNKLKIPGEVISDVGLSVATPGDISDPGMVMVIEHR
ncbi:MAG: hypothetical protein ISS77_01405 [Phycisphaerae bacterium]|nr:hypothetical protein [Phycisphaerae bacterium]